MPDVNVESQPSLDLLDQQKPSLSSTSDMPVIETKPDVVVAKPAAPAKAEPKDESAASDAGDDAPAEGQQPAQKPAKGVQKRIDELTERWRSEERSRVSTEKRLEETLGLLKQAMTGKPAAEAATSEDGEPVEPDSSKYTEQEAYNKDYRSYLRNLARYEGRQEFKAQQKREQETRAKQSAEDRQRSAVNSYQERVSKAREKYPDYDQVAHGNHWSPTKAMADAILEHDAGPDIAHYLGSHVEDAQRISQLSPNGQLIELGLIAAKLSPAQADATQGKTPVSQAPKPIRPLTTASAAGGGSRDSEDSMESYAAKRTKQLQEEGRRGMRR